LDTKIISSPTFAKIEKTPELLVIVVPLETKLAISIPSKGKSLHITVAFIFPVCECKNCDEIKKQVRSNLYFIGLI
jgi:hypothetical protein